MHRSDWLERATYTQLLIRTRIDASQRRNSVAGTVIYCCHVYHIARTCCLLGARWCSLLRYRAGLYQRHVASTEGTAAYRLNLPLREAGGIDVGSLNRREYC
jgi:hypothetical protein